MKVINQMNINKDYYYYCCIELSLPIETFVLPRLEWDMGIIRHFYQAALQ